MAPTLTHPKTGRTVTITKKEAGFYTDKGWKEAVTPDTDAAEAAAAAEKAVAEAAEKEAAEAAAKAEAEAKAAEEKSQKESADGTEAGTSKPAPRKAAKAS